MAGKKHQQPAMMRIAIAGGGGFGYILAQELSNSANAILVLSRQEHPEIEDLGVQVAVVDYGNANELRYALQGVDLLISTIGGTEQLDLIDAARKARVRLFVPSEFEGALSHRSTSESALDRGTDAAMDILRRWSQSKSNPMAHTVFSCGIFYERFARGGFTSFNIGVGQPGGQLEQGDYLVNVENGTAEIVETNAQGNPAQVSMISVYDAARFVSAAIDLGPANWPREFKMRGDQMTVRDIVGVCGIVRGVPFDIITHNYSEIQIHLAQYLQDEDWVRWWYFQRLGATANGRYHFRQANLNEAVNESDVVDVRPVRFRQWLQQVWGPA